MTDLLLVEDDATLRRVLEIHLEAEGFEVRSCGDGKAAKRLIAERLPQIAVLDINLPGSSGFDICLHLRSFRPTPGVVMLTARVDEVDVLLAFDSGADDYVIKPCRPRELVARVRAVLRRLAPESPPVAEISVGRLRLAPEQRRAFFADSPIELTPTEYSLLVAFLREPNRVLSRTDLLSQVFQTQHAGYARNVDCHVARLRRKLERAGLDPSPLGTVHGVGYVFSHDE